MKWEPVDVIRVVALILAFVMFGLGTAMMWNGIAAEGAIDVKSSLLSGSVKTGSAGLFIAFLSFLIIGFVLLTLSTKRREVVAPVSRNHPKSQKVGRALYWTGGVCVCSGAAAALGYGLGFGMLAGASGMAAMFLGIAYITLLEQE